MKKLLNLATFLAFHIPLIQGLTIEKAGIKTTNNTIHVQYRIILGDNERVYKNHILIATDKPSSTVSWKTIDEPIPLTIAHHKETFLGFDHSFTLIAIVQKTDTSTTPEQLHITINNEKGTAVVAQATLTFEPQTKTHTSQKATYETAANTTEPSTEKIQTNKSLTDRVKELTQRLEHTFTQTGSWFLKLLIAFLLGLLLSLTPCIYPMIPITVGLLQAQGNKSVVSNFILSSMYSLGLATTFSIMGLIAASTGNIFGYLMASPMFVLCIVSLLTYFGLSMFGLYNLYIPRFMQKKQSLSTEKKSNPYLSIFIFGLASGTFSSPCVSPGLLLILSAVSTLSNVFMGFLLLFVFGIGISAPLLIIGTFSGSMNVLPRAGMWMIEIQKLFGFMILGMCFFYLKAILPPLIISGAMTLFAIIFGLFYLLTLKASDSFLWRIIKSCFGIAGIAAALYLAIDTLDTYWTSTQSHHEITSWYTDYNTALSKARAENKRLLIDCWAPYCSICKQITEKILNHKAVLPVLDDYIVVTVDTKDANEEPFKTLKSQYDIKGVPDIFIVDATTNTIVKRWHSDLYEQPIEKTIEEFNHYKQ